jgi:hypothetical protein
MNELVNNINSIINNNDYYIIRSDRAGVFFAQIESLDTKTGYAILNDARRIHYWQGATECIGISENGVGKGSRITVPKKRMGVMGVIEVLPCTDEAIAKIKEVREWTV